MRSRALNAGLREVRSSEIVGNLQGLLPFCCPAAGARDGARGIEMRLAAVPSVASGGLHVGEPHGLDVLTHRGQHSGGEGERRTFRAAQKTRRCTQAEWVQRMS